ncbi:hypothetical protein, partial [Nocardia farcinica]|uniref:hypothetical protein n=1 Tax=Nocardia farcinica TaxID=37329 RepID=UPI0024559A78
MSIAGGCVLAGSCLGSLVLGYKLQPRRGKNPLKKKQTKKILTQKPPKKKPKKKTPPQKQTKKKKP